MLGSSIPILLIVNWYLECNVTSVSRNHFLLYQSDWFWTYIIIFRVETVLAVFAAKSQLKNYFFLWFLLQLKLVINLKKLKYWIANKPEMTRTSLAVSIARAKWRNLNTSNLGSVLNITLKLVWPFWSLFIFILYYRDMKNQIKKFKKDAYFLFNKKERM